MAFTKDGSPTDTKFAMIDRSIAHVVRSLGTNAHDDAEFNRHMSSSETQKKLTKFRLFVSLVGATKLATMGVPAFQPNLAYANKVFDFLDKDLVVGEYNLPFRSPRKCLKRDENLRTMACMSAVCNVFMYKQERLRPLPAALRCPLLRPLIRPPSARRRPSTGRRAGWTRTGSRGSFSGRCCTT